MLLQISDQSVILMQTYVLHEDQFRDGLEWAFSLFTMFKKKVTNYFSPFHLLKCKLIKKNQSRGFLRPLPISRNRLKVFGAQGGRSLGGRVLNVMAFV